MDNLRYTIVALLGLGMAACTDNVTETDTAQEYGASARNIQVSVLTKGMSRTETGEPFSNSFYLYIDQTGTENDYFVKMKYNTEVGGGWTVDGNEQELLLIDSPENFRFSAMCFQDDGTAITLDEYCSAEHVYLGGKDILYAKSGDDGCSIDNEGRLEISFSHLFSKLSFSFEKEGSAGGGETSEGGISEGTLPESIVASGISNKFTWTASTGDFSTAVLSYEEGDAVITIQKDAEGKYTCFAVPQEVGTVKLDLGDASSSYLNGLELESGKAVNVMLKNQGSTSGGETEIPAVPGE